MHVICLYLVKHVALCNIYYSKVVHELYALFNMTLLDKAKWPSTYTSLGCHSQQLKLDTRRGLSLVNKSKTLSILVLMLAILV